MNHLLVSTNGSPRTTAPRCVPLAKPVIREAFDWASAFTGTAA